MSPILTLSPSIPVPLTPTLGGTGVANANASTLTLSSAGTLNLNSGTVTGTSGKTLTFSNSLTLAGTDSTTMTFPSTSASIARTDTGQTFTGTQIFNDTAATVGGSFSFTSTGVTSGEVFYMEQTTSTFSGSAIYLDMARGSGTFSGSFLSCHNNNVASLTIASDGHISISSTTLATGLDMSGISTASSGIFKTASGMEVGVSTGTVTWKARNTVSSNNTGSIQFIDHAGTTRYIPYV